VKSPTEKKGKEFGRQTSKVKAIGTPTTSYMKSVAVPCAKYLDKQVQNSEEGMTFDDLNTRKFEVLYRLCTLYFRNLQFKLLKLQWSIFSSVHKKPENGHHL